jgi:cell division protein ZapA (FtsZ GTPase activity inhibitor)
MADQATVKKIQVSIGGRRYTISTDQDSTHVQELADIVNDKLAESGMGSGVTGVNEAMLIALAIANDLLSEREQHVGLKDRIRSQSKQLLERMNMERFRNIA